MDNKNLAIVLILIMAVSSLTLMMVKPANAQSIPKPSVPEFTVQFVDNSYDVPESQSFDPYTGQQIINQGYHVENKCIEVKIGNQQFEPFNNEYNQTINLFYNIRIKGYFEENWTELYRATYGLPLQSADSDYTVFSYTWVADGETWMGSRAITLRYGAKADFQVEAMIGQVVQEGPFSGEDFQGVTSGWSSTQTITVGETSASTSPNPTQSPTNTVSVTPTVLEFPTTIVLTFLVLTALAVAVVSRRKHLAGS